MIIFLILILFLTFAVYMASITLPSIICKHEYGKIIDGVQYCKKCNYAINSNCTHEWKIINRYEGRISDKVKEVYYVMQCKKCGILKTEKVAGV